MFLKMGNAVMFEMNALLEPKIDLIVTFESVTHKGFEKHDGADEKITKLSKVGTPTLQCLSPELCQKLEHQVAVPS